MSLSDALDRVSEAADDGVLPDGPLLMFVIPGPPVAKGRPKISTAGGFARAYTPKTTRTYERAVRASAAEAVQQTMGDWPLTGPLKVEIRAYFQRPKGLFRKSDPDGAFPRHSRPDLDNVVKAVLDGMDGAGVWEDDAQVAELVASKWHAPILGERKDKQSRPHVVVVVHRI